MIAYRFKNLVYVPITKHASTSYSELFSKKLKWEEVQTDSINWDCDKVFAHIIHPYTRHLKGIAQCLYKYNIMDIVNDHRFIKLLGTAVFDLHSYPLAESFGDKIYKIDWLLLDHHEVNGNYITTKFLQNYGIDITEKDIPTLNESSIVLKQTTDRIKSIRDQQDLTGTLTYFYDRDVVLYNRVYQYTSVCDLDFCTWDQCSWLTNYKENK
jgi:hypothetical protein